MALTRHPGLDGTTGLFVDGDDVIVCGFNGQVQRSRDGGASFERLPFDGKRYNINDVTRRHDGGIVVVCGGGRVLESGDEGATWTTSQLSHTSPIHQVVSSAAVDVVAAARDVAWRRGSAPWREVELPFAGWCKAAVVDGDGAALLVYERGAVFRLAPGSDTWQQTAAGQGPDSAVVGEVAAGAFDAASGLVVAVGKGGFVMVSEDGGATFTTPPPATAATLTALQVRGARWLAGTRGGGIVRSDDAGAHWQVVHAEGSLPSAVRAVAERADGSVMACCFDGLFVDGARAVPGAPAAHQPKKTPKKQTTKKPTAKKPTAKKPTTKKPRPR